ncbi:MAG: response regulator [Acidimicrobiales bacterium]
MPGIRILVVDDDADLRAMLRHSLELEDFVVMEAADGTTALTMTTQDRPDAVLLDLNLGVVSGLEVLTQIRRQSTVPVLLVTGRQEEADRVLGLELGADDYIIKPFLPRELAARVRAVLRRAQPGGSSDEVLDFDRLVIRPALRTASLDGKDLEMPPKEFDVLVHLAREPRRVFSKEDLLAAVWASSTEWQDPATVTEHVRRLRRRIEDDPAEPAWIETVRGVGYRFSPLSGSDPVNA